MAGQGWARQGQAWLGKDIMAWFGKGIASRPKRDAFNLGAYDMATGYTKYRVTIGGDALLLHNGQLADPTNAYTKALKQLTSKRKKTDEDHAAISRAEFLGGLYLDSKGRVILPSRLLEAHIAEAARKSKEGKDALSGMFVDTDGVLEYDGGPMTADELADSDEHRLTIGVRIQKNRIMRTRPLLKNWSTSFQVSVLDTAINEDSLKTWLHNGGNLVAIGDYRPRYGRYVVKSIKEVS